MNTQPEALAPASALANELDHQAAFHESQPEYSSAWVQASRCRNAAALLRTQHADIERKDALLRQVLAAYEQDEGLAMGRVVDAITKELAK